MGQGMITNIKFDGIDFNDYPDFVDAYIVSADLDGVPMTSEQIDKLNENPIFVYEQLVTTLSAKADSFLLEAKAVPPPENVDSSIEITV